MFFDGANWVIDTGYPTTSDFAPQLRNHETTVLLYTSGTTGRPKSVALSERNIISNARLQPFVQRKQGATLDEGTLRAACRKVPEPCKIPRTFTFVDSLPRTITGKTDKRTLVTSAAE